MGSDKIRHLLARPRADGAIRYHWQPSASLIALGLSAEALGTDAEQAHKRAIELNALGDSIRRLSSPATNGPPPGSVSRLFRDYKASDEFAELKPRTRGDYAYYLEKIEADFGAIMVRALTARVIKVYYKRQRKQVSVTWAYHILATFRTVLSWAVAEDWIKQNPALDVTMKSPAKRKVVWTLDQAQAYAVAGAALGWHSIVAMAHVFDSIGQSPVDVRTLPRKAYDGRTIDTSRAKTGRTGPPIPLFPTAIVALDAYLEASPRLPEAPLFTNDRIGGEWNESTLQKKHRQIRGAAGLPSKLQLQDFRTTALTEGGASSGTRDELRGLARHSTAQASEHYVHPDSHFVESIQRKRLAHRNKNGAKVGLAEE